MNYYYEVRSADSYSIIVTKYIFVILLVAFLFLLPLVASILHSNQQYKSYQITDLWGQ